MQAITLYQPWATLIALGLKHVETRSWPAPKVEMNGTACQVWRRHGLAIHAARHTPGSELRGAFQNPFIRVALAYHGITESNWTGQAGSLPHGAIVAVVTLTAVRPAYGAVTSQQEQAFGDYSPGRFAWFVGDVINLNDHPVPATGRQRIWTVPLHTVALLNVAANQAGQLPQGGFQ